MQKNVDSAKIDFDVDCTGVPDFLHHPALTHVQERCDDTPSPKKAWEKSAFILVSISHENGCVADRLRKS